MEIFKTFGIDWIIILAQIVNFLIILYILKRFVYKPVFKIFKQREELIKESIKKAEDAKHALEKAQKEERELIKKAKETSEQLIKDAKETSAEMIKHSEEETRKQTQQMLAEAKEQIVRETKTAQQELSKHVSELSVAILKKSLGNVFTEKEQSEVVAKAAKELKKDK